MAIEIWEKWNSGAGSSGTDETRELQYGVSGTHSDSVVEALVKATAPINVVTDAGLILVRKNVEWSTAESDDIWSASVKYGKRDPARDSAKNPPKTGDFRISFDTGGGTAKLYQSIKTVKRYVSDSEAAPTDFKQCINVTKDGVEGCDVIVPIFKFNVTHYVAAEIVTDEYVGRLFQLTGKTNKKRFRNFDPCEALLAGVSGSLRGNPEDEGADYELTKNFLCSPSITDAQVGDIKNIDKKGWHFLWVWYLDEKDESGKFIRKVPKQVNIEQVYQEGDFDQLGLS